MISLFFLPFFVVFVNPLQAGFSRAGQTASAKNTKKEERRLRAAGIKNRTTAPHTDWILLCLIICNSNH
ncbi:MAG: hypothetical protein IJT76_08960 [Clostridia bacterium]|nr:hypothetical protein [Clostridia bacterium]